MKEKLIGILNSNERLNFLELYNRGLLNENHLLDRAFLVYREDARSKTLDQVAQELCNKTHFTPNLIKKMIRRARKIELMAIEKENRK